MEPEGGQGGCSRASAGRGVVEVTQSPAVAPKTLPLCSEGDGAGEGGHLEREGHSLTWVLNKGRIGETSKEPRGCPGGR